MVHPGLHIISSYAVTTYEQLLGIPRRAYTLYHAFLRLFLGMVELANRNKTTLASASLQAIALLHAAGFPGERKGRGPTASSAATLRARGRAHLQAVECVSALVAALGPMVLVSLALALLDLMQAIYVLAKAVYEDHLSASVLLTVLAEGGCGLSPYMAFIAACDLVRCQVWTRLLDLKAALPSPARHSVTPCIGRCAGRGEPCSLPPPARFQRTRYSRYACRASPSTLSGAETDQGATFQFCTLPRDAEEDADAAARQCPRALLRVRLVRRGRVPPALGECTQCAPHSLSGKH